MKYLNSQVVFQEFPGETTLAFNITNCPNHCPDCHSKQLWEDIGEELTRHVVDDIYKKYGECITCIGIMGGDASWKDVYDITKYIKENYPALKVGWYSGREATTPDLCNVLDYIKLGPYMKECGDLTQPTTNQRLYKKEDGYWKDITYMFNLKKV